MNSFIKDILNLFGTVEEITEELQYGQYKGLNYFVNRLGTLCITPVRWRVRKNARYVLYKGNPYLVRSILKSNSPHPKVSFNGTAFQMSHLMIIAFNKVSKINKDMRIRHKDGDQSNCCIDNLELAYHKELVRESRTKLNGLCIIQEYEKNGGTHDIQKGAVYYRYHHGNRNYNLGRKKRTKLVYEDQNNK